MITVKCERLMSELRQLATFTDCVQRTDPSLPEPQRAVTRIVFTKRDLEVRAWFEALAGEAGFLVREDAIGNTFVRWTGSEPSLPAVATGSHTDAIPHAGMYDGTVGVLGGLEAMRALRESGFAPRRSIELVMFTSEEPTRFGIGCLGSRLLAGVLAPDLADALPDRLPESDPDAPGGLTLRQVRTGAGFPDSLHTVALQPGHFHAWVELHIEQGPLLECDGLDCGIVTAIAGPASYRVSVEGEGGHAGALLMPGRHDALCAAAELVLAIECTALDSNARSRSTDTVATAGTLTVHPGAVNAVPSRVVLSLDLRDTDAARREEAMEHIRAAAEAIAARRGVRIACETINADAPAVCDPYLIRVLEEACAAEGVRFRHLVSRAYHDTSFVSRIAPATMLFIPCRGGVSHRADEYAAPDALERGTRVLAACLARLASA